MSYEQIEQAVIEWAANQADIQGVILVGSRTRTSPPSDNLSDLDFIIYTSDVQKYAADRSWLMQFDDVWMTVLEDDGIEPEWVAVYEGGLKADFLLSPATENSLTVQLAKSRHTGALSRGMRVLVDHYPESGTIQLPFEQSHQPSKEQVRALCESFLINTVRAAKFIKRGDLWRASHICSCKLHRQLLQMIEWNAVGKDVWYDGRFIHDWASPEIVARLPKIFAAYEVESLRDALLEMLALFRELMNDDFPAYDHVENWIRNLFQKETT